jgi:hypothetical protein
MSDTQPNADDNKDDPKDLRTQLDASNKERAEQAVKLERYQSDEKLQEVGFAHLNKRQRTAILRDLKEEGKEIDAEAAKEAVEGYGWPVTATTPTPATTTDPAPVGDNVNPVNDGVDQSMGAFSAMENAQRAALAGQVDATLEAEIAKTKNADELTSLIRTKGPRSGLVHAWDVE